MSIRLSRRDCEIFRLCCGWGGCMQLAGVDVFENSPSIVFENIRPRANVETSLVAGNYRRYLSRKPQV